MSTGEDLLRLYKGEIVPRSFNAGYVALSYFVSWIGAVSTLELLNRRTFRAGWFNHLILVASSVTMGGIAIWCMHFIGNRAIVLAHDESELHIQYSGSFTAISFFLPIVVLLAAFMAIGANNKVSWWRIGGGGTLAGGAICGMHYLGNASINNYRCTYHTAHIVGATLIAVFASIVALSVFFVLRASWTDSPWKRALTAVILAGAVSGMHWTAATGTEYRLDHLNDSNQFSQITTVIVVICLSVGAALFMVVSAVYATWATRRNASKAQQVVLAAAVFDRSGRILVTLDGSLPSEKITDTYIERTRSDTFNIAHPLFHWMFQASRNWASVSSMIDGMTAHLGHLPRDGRGVRLVSDDGVLIENYDAIVRELFCVAAANLAQKLKDQLASAGTLWDEILPTGANDPQPRLDVGEPSPPAKGTSSPPSPVVETGRESRAWKHQDYGRGSLMFLVRHLEGVQDADQLEAAGFRFADITQVSGIIGSRMQIRARNLSDRLGHMAAFAEDSAMLDPGVHLAFFGVKARVGSFGFDVLVRKSARNLLPTMPVTLERLDSWQMDIIRQFDRMSVTLLLHSLEALKRLSPREVLFASQMSDAVEALRAWIDDPMFDNAVFTSKVVQAPCRAQAGQSAKSCTLVSLCLMLPIHATASSSARCEFVPLNFFKVRQITYPDSPHRAAFTRYVHRELSPIINAPPPHPPPPQTTYPQIGRGASRRGNKKFGPLSRLRRASDNSYATTVVGSGNGGDGYPNQGRLGRKSTSSARDSIHSDSTTKLWSQEAAEEQPAQHQPQHQPSSLGGIMVSQEIQVDVRQVDEDDGASTGGGGGGGGSGNPPKSPSAMSADRVTMAKAVRGAAVFDYEMENLPGGADTEEGRRHRRLGAAVIESEKGNEVITFVDELFAVCVDGL